MKEENEEWTDIITPTNKWYQLDLKEIYDYKDLLVLFVRRDFVAQFKQTVLGPLWFVIQPLLQALTMYFVFGKMADIGTDGLPPFLFYLSGTILWSYFADCLNQNAKTFTGNANIFGKVYFPRLILPMSVVVSNFFKFAIRLAIFIVAYAYFAIFTDADLSVSPYIWVLVPLVILMAGYGLSLGILFSSLTTKYRDFTFLLGFGVQLLMYTSAVIYPLSEVDEYYRTYLRYNPFVNISESFKYITMGKGEFSPMWLGYSFLLLISITVVALIVFKRTERSFMDTV